jgi:hypothetical protein
MSATDQPSGGPGRWAPLLAPFLVGWTPVLFHWGRNHAESQVLPALGMLVIATALAAAVLGGLTPVLPDRDRRAAAASFVVFLLAFYGFLFQHVWKRVHLPRPWMAHVPLGLLLCGLVLGAVLFLRRGRGNVSRGMRAVTLALVIVCALSAVQIVRRAFSTNDPRSDAGWKAARAKSEAPVPEAKAAAGAPKPDIYYIILDMYTREDVLRNVYQFDNSEFLDGLRRRGFVVADRSCSNYSHTILSLASSLNMTYLEDLGHSQRDHQVNQRALCAMIQGNRVSRTFKGLGYRYVTNLTHFVGTEKSETADVTFALTPTWMRQEFVDSLLGTTAGCLLRPNRVEYHRHSLESIRQAAVVEGPKFVFWHFLLPHNPFVFDRHGNVTQAAYSRMDLDDEGRKQPFVEQTLFLNGQILEIVDHILRTSSSPPVIIVQGDHGPMTRQPKGAAGNQEAWLPSSAERMPILNAILAPEPVRRRLYPTLTPVNTFRILLSELFGAGLPLLEDRNYFYNYLRNIEPTDVTDRVTPR